MKNNDNNEIDSLDDIIEEEEILEEDLIEEPQYEETPLKKQNNVRNEYHNREYYKMEADKRKRKQLANAQRRKNRQFNRYDEDNEEIEEENKSTLQKGIDAGKEAVDKTEKVVDKLIDTAEKVKTTKKKVDKVKTAVKTIKSAKIVKFIIKHPWILLVFLFIIVFILMLVFLVGDTERKDPVSDNEYDFTTVSIELQSNNVLTSNRVHLDYITLEQYATGAAYYYMYLYVDGFKDLPDEQRLEGYKAFMVYIKSIGLAIGNYDSETKKITLQSGSNGVAVCEPIFGCSDVQYLTNHTYVSTELAYRLLNAEITDENGKKLKGEINESFEAEGIPTNELSMLEEAYLQTEEELLVPVSEKRRVTKVTQSWFGDPSTDSNTIMSEFFDGTELVKNRIVDGRIYKMAAAGESYEEILNNLFASNNSGTSFTIYNYNDASNYYSYGYKGYWYWPIGSKEATDDEGIIYDGDPVSTMITAYYGVNTGGTVYNGIVIWANSGTPVIAADAGTVIEVGEDDKTCGNYVKIDHGNNLVAKYCYLKDKSIVVKENEEVKKGQIIGKVGSTGKAKNSSLYFEVYLDNETVDPLDYVDPDNPRPVNTTVLGTDDEQSVCLTLKDRGFSDEAVSAIMGNMQSESSFNPVAIGDNGTSFGLCQWHDGADVHRWTDLKNFCGNMEATIGCQVDFIIEELTTSSYYGQVYDSLYNESHSISEKSKNWSVIYEGCTQCYVGGPEYYARASQAEGYYSYVKNGCK